jgi:hypothetical protein
MSNEIDTIRKFKIAERIAKELGLVIDISDGYGFNVKDASGNVVMRPPTLNILDHNLDGWAACVENNNKITLE